MDAVNAKGMDVGPVATHTVRERVARWSREDGQAVSWVVSVRWSNPTLASPPAVEARDWDLSQHIIGPESRDIVVSTILRLLQMSLLVP